MTALDGTSAGQWYLVDWRSPDRISLHLSFLPSWSPQPRVCHGWFRQWGISAVDLRLSSSDKKNQNYSIDLMHSLTANTSKSTRFNLDSMRSASRISDSLISPDISLFMINESTSPYGRHWLRHCGISTADEPWRVRRKGSLKDANVGHPIIKGLHNHFSVAEVQFRTDAENRNQWNRTESSVQSSSSSPVLAAVRFSVLRILQNSRTVWEPVKIYSWNVKKCM